MSGYLRSNRSTKTIAAIGVALFVCLESALLFAQVTSGTIFGRVKDVSGAYIAGATVTVRSPETGAQRTVTTSDSGDFVVPNMPPDTYTITVEAKSFKKLESKGVRLSAADKLNAGEFELSPGAATESVTVTADAGQLQLQSNSGERSDVVTSRQLNERLCVTCVWRTILVEWTANTTIIYDKYLVDIYISLDSSATLKIHSSRQKSRPWMLAERRNRLRGET